MFKKTMYMKQIIIVITVYQIIAIKNININIIIEF